MFKTVQSNNSLSLLANDEQFAICFTRQTIEMKKNGRYCVIIHLRHLCGCTLSGNGWEVIRIQDRSPPFVIKETVDSFRFVNTVNPMYERGPDTIMRSSKSATSVSDASSAYQQIGQNTLDAKAYEVLKPCAPTIQPVGTCSHTFRLSRWSCNTHHHISRMSRVGVRVCNYNFE